MKKMFMVAIMMIGISSFAQEKSVEDKKAKRAAMEKLTPEQRNEKHLKKLTADLSLSDSQQDEMKKIIAEQSAKREAKKAERMKLNEAQRAERKKEMEANEARIKAVLTPQQVEKWTAIKNERREKGKKFHDIKKKENKK